MDSLLAASNFMYPLAAADQFAKNKETVHSETFNYMNNHNSSQQQSSNLTRYQSVPSSFLESLVSDSVVADDYCSSNLETEMNFFESGDKYTKGLETDLVNNSGSCGVENLFRGFSSNVEGQNINQVKKETSNGNRSSLVRQSSSPAGFLSSLADKDIGTGFTGMNDVGNFRSGNKTNTGLRSTTNRPSNYMNFSSGTTSHSRFMPQSAANVNGKIGATDLYLANGQNGGNSNRHYVPNFPNGPTCNSLKRNRDDEVKMLSNMTGLDKQKDDFNHYTSGLVHQLSLPSTSAELATMENFLQFQQDSTIPCKIRAKRGFATHPRSIAERVTRTRISARMKKLQDLFPNMDKQANTADMLDLAVVYIKDLQKEVQMLNETRSKCTCPSKRK